MTNSRAIDPSVLRGLKGTGEGGMDFTVSSDGGQVVDGMRIVDVDELSLISILDDDDNVVMAGSFVWVADIRAKEAGGPCEVFIA